MGKPRREPAGADSDVLSLFKPIPANSSVSSGLRRYGASDDPAFGHYDTGGAPLTAREIQVLQFIGAGCTSRQIGDHMRVSHKTVENHKQRIFGKLGVQNQAHAVSVAFRKGYIRPEDVRTLADAQ